MSTKFDQRIKEYITDDAFKSVEMYHGMSTPEHPILAQEVREMAIDACTRQLTDVYGVTSTEETKQCIELAVGIALAVSYGGTVEV